MLLTFWTGPFFVVGGCPVHWCMSTSIPDPYPLEARSNLPFVTIKNVFRCCQMSLGKQNCPWFRTTVLGILIPKESVGPRVLFLISSSDKSSSCVCPTGHTVPFSPCFQGHLEGYRSATGAAHLFLSQAGPTVVPRRQLTK